MDPISDMLTRIRNAVKAEHKTVNIPMSKLKLEIARVLKKEGYVDDFKKLGKDSKKFIEINLKPSDAKALAGKYPAVISAIKRISKPGQRIYLKASEIPYVKNGYGISIISTPKGLMTGKEARKAHLGGEMLLEIW